MTVNKIESKCPRCNSITADVLGLITTEKKTIVVVKCIERHHQYMFDVKGSNPEFKKFFK